MPLPSKIPTLKTPRLILRPFVLDDAKIVAELANDKEIATNTKNLPYPYTEELAIEWINAHPDLYSDSKLMTLAVVQSKRDIVIGAIGLEIDTNNDRAELGYWLGRPYWDQGYATEAARRLMHYAFTDLQLNRVHSCHLTLNPKSGRILKKLGMSHEGHLRQQIKKWGEYQDLELYGILASEYKP